MALLLVISGWLALWIAIFADIGATLLVVANFLRLLIKYYRLFLGITILFQKTINYVILII